MNIKIGSYYINKTRRFLLPSLIFHGNVFTKKISRIFKLAVGIHDILLDDSEISNKKCIYIMTDKKVQEKIFYNFLEWIRFEDYYITDYCPDSDIRKSRKHIIVLNIPKDVGNAYDKFLQGKYSKMYTKSQLNLLFSEPQKINEYNILSKNKKALDQFIKKINSEFNVNSNPNDFLNSELELPLKKSEEIFNLSDDKYPIYFNNELKKIWN